MLDKRNAIRFKLYAEANASEAIRMIHQYSENQVELWRQIPSWALEADGRLSYSGLLLSKAYCEGLWALSASCLCVDLKTGKLVKIMLGNRYVLSAEDDNIILSLVFKLDELDASKILKGLKEQAKINTSGMSNAMNQKRRDELRRELGLAPVAI